jgi:hypothetical protein
MKQVSELILAAAAAAADHEFCDQRGDRLARRKREVEARTPTNPRRAAVIEMLSLAYLHRAAAIRAHLQNAPTIAAAHERHSQRNLDHARRLAKNPVRSVFFRELRP